MKRFFLCFLIAIAFSCNNNEATNTAADNRDADTSEGNKVAVNYPYQIDQPDNWEMGSNANTQAALMALKKWEDASLDESLSYFGDSVRVQMDNFDSTLHHNRLKEFLSSARNQYKSVDIEMTDWESVVSKDKNQEWVTLWYTQKWETKDGLQDSLDIINDMQLKNGKIVRLVEYSRKLPK